MGKPNVGEQIALQDGPSGKVWGVRETAGGVFVQFGPDAAWHLVGAAEPAPVAPEPAEAEPEEPAAPEAKADKAPADPDGDK